MGIENDLVVVWVVDIDLISVYGSKLTRVLGPLWVLVTLTLATINSTYAPP